MKDRFKKIFSMFKEALPLTLLFSAFLSLVIILIFFIFVLILSSFDFNNIGFFSFIFMFMFFVVILGIFVPFIYSYLSCNGVFHGDPVNKDNIRFTSFLKTSLIGMQRPFRGVLNISSTLMWSLLIFFGLELVLNSLSTSILYLTNIEFKSIMDGLTSFINAGHSLEEVMKKLNESGYYDFMNLINIYIIYISTFISVLYFLYRIGINLFKYNFLLKRPMLPKREFNLYFKLTIREKRSEFYREFFQIAWIYILLYTISFTLTYFLMTFLGDGINITIIALTSICISVIILLPFLPLLLNYYLLKTEEYNEIYEELVYKRMQQELKMAKLNLEQYDEANRNLIMELEKQMNLYEENKNKEDNKETKEENKDNKNIDKENKKEEKNNDNNKED